MNLKSQCYKSIRLICLVASGLLTTMVAAQSTLPTGNRFGTADNGSHWNETGADTVKKTDVPIGLYVWHIEPRFGTISPAQPDTLPHLFPNESSTGGLHGQYNFTGNLGAPRQSRLFADRLRQGFAEPFIFQAPYDYFLTETADLLFTNTKSPITNITYHECGNKQNGEDRIRGLFATNVNKRLGLGFKLDYLYGRGYYDSQSTAQFDGTLWGAYRGEHYQLHTYYSANHLKNAENGGIESDDYVTRPETFPTTYGTADMPTRLTKTWNRLYVNTLYLTHRYALGFRRYRDSEGKVVGVQAVKTHNKLLANALTLGDSVTTASTALQPDTTLTSEFVPVAGFIHTLRLDHNNRRFLSNLAENATNSTYFNNFYLPGDSANDLTKYFHLQNLLALEMREGFNNWVKTGLRLYVRHDLYKYTLPNEAAADVSYNENHVSLGVQLLKEQGHFFHYYLLGEVRTSGTDWGEFNLAGNMDFNIPFGRRQADAVSGSDSGSDTLRVRLKGGVRNELPSFYYRHYHARNAWWDNSLNKVLTADVSADLRYKRSRLAVSLASLQNQTYFQEQQAAYINSEGATLARYGVSVGQSASNVQLLSATLGQDFRWGILNWENELTYQLTSDNTVVPVPALTAWSNLYILFRIAKVLRTELGADVSYFTPYYAPTYSPIIGQYALQDQAVSIKVGGYPIVNVYANFHLKNTRFYVMASHVNYSNGSGKPFLVPHYPLNRMVLRLGLSWNFFN